MLAAHEACDMNAMPAPACERQQCERLAIAIPCDHDEGGELLARADFALPGGQEIETLIGSMQGATGFEIAPDRLGLTKLGERCRRRPGGAALTS